MTEAKKDLRELLAQARPFEPGEDSGVGRVLSDSENALWNALEDGTLTDLLRVVEAVATKTPTQPDGVMGLCCPMYCGALTEDEPVQSYSDGFVDSVNPTDVEMDLYDARRKAWEAQAVAGMQHHDDCTWVLARKLTGGVP